MNTSTLQMPISTLEFNLYRDTSVLASSPSHTNFIYETQKQSWRTGNVFGEVMPRSKTKNDRITCALVEALRMGNIEMFYQPKVDLQTGVAVGAEALIRWKSKDGHIIYPGEFLPFVHNAECLALLDKYVIESAMRQSITWQREGIFPVISVNVSPGNYGDPRFANLVIDLMEKMPEFNPSQLAIEILETVSLSDTSAASTTLRRLHKLGIRFYLDDFGTGRSSAACLKAFPIDSIKIDKGFIHELPSGPHSTQNKAIVAATMMVAQAFGAHVIAEGIETPEQAREVSHMGITTGQGFLFAKAMNASQFAHWYANKNTLVPPVHSASTSANYQILAKPG